MLFLSFYLNQKLSVKALYNVQGKRKKLLIDFDTPGKTQLLEMDQTYLSTKK